MSAETHTFFVEPFVFRPRPRPVTGCSLPTKTSRVLRLTYYISVVVRKECTVIELRDLARVQTFAIAQGSNGGVAFDAKSFVCKDDRVDLSRLIVPRLSQSGLGSALCPPPFVFGAFKRPDLL